MLLTMLTTYACGPAAPLLTLGLAGWANNLLTLGFLLVCLVLILIVLIQRPQGGGLSGAFGSGAGSGQTAFGAKTGDALTFATIGIFILFLIAAIGLNFAARPTTAQQNREQVATAAEENAAEPETAAATDNDQDSSDAAQPGPAEDAVETEPSVDETPAVAETPDAPTTGDGG